MNRKKIMYRPTSTNGIPHKTMNSDAAFPPLRVCERTDVSQKIAKPPHNMLNGMRKRSELRSTRPLRGCLDHSKDSPTSSSRAITWLESTVMALPAVAQRGVAWHHFASRIDAHVAAAPSAHARLGLPREIVVLHKCNLQRAAIFRDRRARDFLGAFVFLARRHQRAAILRRPRVELGIRQLKTIRSELQRERDEFGHLGNIQPMDHDVERQRKADFAGEPGAVECFSMLSHTGDRLGTLALRPLDTHLNMFTPGTATPPQPVLCQ